MLLDALHGIAHLHWSGIIHSDVKPANILVCVLERGRLADFDISIDTRMRTSAAWITRTIRGFTQGFQAPELAESGRASKATDIFAFGRTVAAVMDFCEPSADTNSPLPGQTGAECKDARGQTGQTIARFTAHDPNDRPSAEEAADLPFFLVLSKISTRETKMCDFCVQNGDDGLTSSEGGVECSEGHFHCCRCVVRLARDSLEVANEGRLEIREGKVMCWRHPIECATGGFQDSDLARFLPAIDFQAYLRARIEILQRRKKAELEEQMRQLLAEELQRLSAMEEQERRVLQARKYLEEEVLQMRCPRATCRRAFFDFDGCFALSCASCPCKFCAWCLKDCGNDSHIHCRRCLCSESFNQFFVFLV